MTEITIEYTAIQNGRGSEYGWLPVIYINGHLRGNTWAANGFSKDLALSYALGEAMKAEERYCGGRPGEVEIVER